MSRPALHEVFAVASNGNLQAFVYQTASQSSGICSKMKMEMTTPVISTGGQQGPQGDKMQFPIERKYGEDPDILPLPNDSKYGCFNQDCASCALLQPLI